MSDSTGRGWTEPRSGSVVQLSDGSLAVQPLGLDNVLVAPVIDGTERYRLYNSETDSWSQPYSGELDVVDGEHVVRSGDIILNSRNEYRDLREPEATWRPYVPFTTGETLEQAEEESYLERIQRGFSDGYASQADPRSVVSGPSEEMTRLRLQTQGIMNPEDLGDQLQNFSNGAGYYLSGLLHNPLVPYSANLSRATIDPLFLGQRHVEGTFGTTSGRMRTEGLVGLTIEASLDLVTLGMAPSITPSRGLTALDPTVPRAGSPITPDIPRAPQLPQPRAAYQMSASARRYCIGEQVNND